MSDYNVTPTQDELAVVHTLCDMANDAILDNQHPAALRYTRAAIQVLEHWYDPHRRETLSPSYNSSFLSKLYSELNTLTCALNDYPSLADPIEARRDKLYSELRSYLETMWERPAKVLASDVASE